MVDRRRASRSSVLTLFLVRQPAESGRLFRDYSNAIVEAVRKLGEARSAGARLIPIAS